MLQSIVINVHVSSGLQLNSLFTLRLLQLVGLILFTGHEGP
jgi:hypothetical protein